MKNKTFIFKYDPECNIERMFVNFSRAAAGRLKSVEPHMIKSNNLEVLLSSIDKNRWEIFHTLVKKKPHTLAELTDLLGKDYENVQREAKILEGMGIIKLLKKGNQEIKPVALYDRIVFDLSLQERKKGGADYRATAHPKQNN